MEYPYTIKFTDRDQFYKVFGNLHWIPDKNKKQQYAKPPVYYKSSKYRVWFDYADRVDHYGTTIRGFNMIDMIFRDEEDYLMALLLK
jgi:hypothetical protein